MVTGDEPTKWAAVKIRRKTLERIRSLSHPGQAVDGFMNEAMDAFEFVNPHKKK